MVVVLPACSGIEACQPNHHFGTISNVAEHLRMYLELHGIDCKQLSAQRPLASMR